MESGRLAGGNRSFSLGVLAGLAVGALVFGLWAQVRKVYSPVMAVDGGTFEFSFKADKTFDRKSQTEVGSLLFYKATERWTFKNRTDRAVEFWLPDQQRMHVVSERGREIMSLPKGASFGDPITLQSGEVKVISFQSDVAMNKTGSYKRLNDGLEVVARIDSRFEILTCERTVHPVGASP